jgi:Domain of Unknown Function (DUF1080)
MKLLMHRCRAILHNSERLFVLPLMICAALNGCATAPRTETPGASTAKAATQPPAKATLPAVVPTAGPGEVVLFDGKTLTGWKDSDFAGTGQVEVKDGRIILGMGAMTGVTWTNVAALPRMNYEIQCEAMRVEGSDFFCGLTFMAGTNPCSLIIGGWGGGLVGLSSLDGDDASSNETTKHMSFDNGKWYVVRLRVMPNKIQAWINDEKVVDVDTTDRRISVRYEVEPSIPLGFSTWSTTGALRNIRLKKF